MSNSKDARSRLKARSDDFLFNAPPVTEVAIATPQPKVETKEDVMRHWTIYLSDSVHKSMQLACLDDRIPLSALIEALWQHANISDSLPQVLAIAKDVAVDRRKQGRIKAQKKQQ